MWGAGVGAGVKGPGWVAGEEEEEQGAGAMLQPGRGWESPSSRLC